MSLPQAIVAITTPMNQAVNVGTPTTVGAIVFANESPYAVQFYAGGSGKWVSPTTEDILYTNGAAFDGSVTLITSDILSNAGSAPSFVGLLTTYAPGEAIPGTYPVSLNRISNLGNAVTTNVTTPNSLEQDMLTPFVLGVNSFVATKDGSVANQLDVTSGVALLRQSDSSLGRVAPTATTFDTTTPSATYFLDLQPDGSWSFATTHSGISGYLPIAQVTTDGSGNIATVTDKRQMNTELLGAMGVNGSALIEMQTLGLLAPDLGAGITASIGHLDGTNGAFSNTVFHNTPMIGASPQGYYWASWNGSATQIPLSLGGDFAGAVTWIGGLGNIGKVAGQASAGSFGVPVIVAQVINTHITTTGAHTILTYTIPAAGLYRFSSTVYNGTGATQRPSILATYTGGNSAAGSGSNLTSPLGGPFDGTTTALVAGTDFPLLPQVIYLKAATNFVFQYTSGAATPNDNISVILERLS